MSFNLKYPQIYLFFLFTAALISCKDSSRPDVSGIKLDVKIERFDLDLYAGRGKAVAAQDQLFSRKYGNFYEDYIHRMVGTPEYTGEQILSTLYKDKAYADLNREKDSVFKDLQLQEQGLTESFRYIKYYFPKIKVPRFIAFISGFAVQAPIGDQYMGIGLDMFLGKDSQFYGAIVQSVPRYLSKRFAPEYIVPRITETYVREELFPEADEDRTLLSKMVHNGKILYFMDQVLPEDLADTVKIGYTAKQLSWCATYEGDIWAYLISNNLLYETDDQKIQVYVSEGPFTPGLGEKNESAPKLGSWIGWQIVRKYMDAHPDVSLQQLMAEKDAQAILQGSKYKPKSGK
ncbi:gliding motility lipoprotein GldB [Pedobacter sp. MC2016-14]|uniref:gliding motility lipoprotein GldB n=1 Tax=Pedobacter sp. MC2016-14 TaxID=2897327 RepID=UPI001E3306FA|nr:gliding motility lipoprotein GldB [Pedobacter sp. MC2016-14]MCD0486819.1 gliding motility lipoprotein GldB [Pedobacter sp. MC2016-14]